MTVIPGGSKPPLKCLCLQPMIINNCTYRLAEAAITIYNNILHGNATSKQSLSILPCNYNYHLE